MQYDPDRYGPYSIAGQYRIPMSRDRACELIELYADYLDLNSHEFSLPILNDRFALASISQRDLEERCRIYRYTRHPFSALHVDICELVITLLTTSPGNIRPVIRAELAYLHTWCMIKQDKAYEDEVTSGNFFLGQKAEKWNGRFWRELRYAFTWFEPLTDLLCDSLSDFRTTSGTGTTADVIDILEKYYAVMEVRWKSHCHSDEVYSFPE